jgi:hypothetical protein
MKNELLEIRELLGLREDLKVVLRGSGKSAFLYIRSPKCAAEVSIHGQEFFVEYWDEADEESEKAAVSKQIVESVSEVLKRLTEWFQR